MENIIQAICRDLLVHVMMQFDDIVLHVHDEIVVEENEGSGMQIGVERAMKEAPAWAAGLPIAVEGWTGRRFRK